jgi:hypothetical protein
VEDVPSPAADPVVLMARRRALKAERERLAQDRWLRFQAASRRRYGPRAGRALPLRVGHLLARAKWPGRALLLAASGAWHASLLTGLGESPGPASSLAAYVRAGPDPAVRPRALFDQAAYLSENPALAGSAWAPLAHYLVLGDRDGRDPHPLLDVAAYRAQVGDHLGRLTALQHFLFRGAAEGLDPHPLFDLRFYVGQCEAVAQSGENPLVHYLREGWRQGLDPHPLLAGTWYLERYPQAAAAGVAPLLHYVAHGAAQGLDPHPLIDAAHWAAQAGRAVRTEPVTEFLRIGGPARKSPTPHFNPTYYVQQLGGSPEVQANPLLHYLEVGSFEGVWPAGDFDEAAYFAACPQAVESGLTALDHWVRQGTERPQACVSTAVISSPEALAANMRAASTPDPFAYDWGAYEALSDERRRIEPPPAAAAATPAATPLAGAAGIVVVVVAPGAMAAARQAVAEADAEFILLVEPGLSGAQDWASALKAAFADDVAAVAPLVVEADGRRSPGSRIAADGTLQPAGSALGRDVEAPAGALAVRRARLAQVGGLDPAALTAEGLFADLALKLRAGDLALEPAPGVVLGRTAHPEPWPVADLMRDRQRLFERWTAEIGDLNRIRVIALRVTGAIDWEAVGGARPNWRGHLQPRLPDDPAPYDLADPETLRRQADLAGRYGLAGFCHQVADVESAARAWATDAPAFPYCLAWTGEDNPAAILPGLAPGLAAPHALRVEGRAVLLLPAQADAGAWRAAAAAAGVADLYLVQRGGPADADPRKFGFDARMQDAATESARIRQTGPSFNPRFDGRIYDYRQVVSAAFATPARAWPQLPLVQAGQDSTPAAPDMPAIFHDASPGAFQAWLEWALDNARAEAAPGARLVFVDSWNDWMHGAALEPDRRLGHGWLEAVANALDAELLDR